MKKWKAAALLVCAGLLVSGCSQQTKQPEQSASNEKKEKTAEEINAEAKQAKLDMIELSAYDNVAGLELEPGTYFSVIGRSSSKDYWKGIRAGAEAAVADLNAQLGYEGSDKIKVVYSAPGTSDNVGEQVSILDEELSRYPDALGISIIDVQSCQVQFDLATQNSVPIVLFDSMSDYQGVMARVGTDNLAAAKEAAVHMAEAVEDEGEVLVFVNDSVSTTGKERVEGFCKEIEENHPQMSIGGVYYKEQLDELKEEMIRSEEAEEEAEERAEEAAEGPETDDPEEPEEELTPEELEEKKEELSVEDVLDYVLAKHPEAKGIYTSNGETALDMVDACERARREEIKIVTFDADTEEVAALKDGKIYGTIIQNPYGIGYATIVAQARSILELGNEAEVDTGYAWVSADNINDENIQLLIHQTK